MRPEQIGELVNGVITFVLGLLTLLIALRAIGGSKPGVSPKRDEWHQRYGGFMKVVGLFVMLFGVYLTTKALFFQSAQAPGSTPPAAWVQVYTDDRRFSAEFPAAPTASIKNYGGVETHNQTLSQKERDCNFILSWSAVAEAPGMTDDERLDTLRDSLLASSPQGKSYTFVTEERLAGRGAGRLLVYHIGGSYVQRFKVFILDGRAYRTVATTPRGDPAADKDGMRFLESMKAGADVK